MIIFHICILFELSEDYSMLSFEKLHLSKLNKVLFSRSFWKYWDIFHKNLNYLFILLEGVKENPSPTCWFNLQRLK